MKKLWLFVLLLTGCLTIGSVSQPAAVSVGQSFTITVEGMHDATTYSGTAVWLGMMLPDYVEAESVRYKTSGGIESVETEPDSLLGSQLQQVRPPDSGMYWAAFSCTPPDAESGGTWKAQAYLHACDSTLPGHYLFDYYVGYYYLTWNIEDSMLDQPLEVTGVGAAEMRAARMVKSGRTWPSLFRDRLNIEVPTPDDVRIVDAGGRLVRFLRVDGAGSWDGRDRAGRRVPAGDFFLRSRHLCGRVTLLD